MGDEAKKREERERERERERVVAILRNPKMTN